MSAAVPCGTCTLCCYGDILLRNDEVTALPTVTKRLGGGTFRMLRQKPDGECAHLIEGRCSVYEQRPRICRDFDCRDHYYLPAAERRRKEAVLTKPRDRAVIARGRQLVEESK